MSKPERRIFLKKALAALAAIPLVGCGKQPMPPGAMCYAVAPLPFPVLPEKKSDEESPGHQKDNPEKERD